MTTMPPISGAARLVLLLKASPGTGAKIAHQAGYAFYGSPARWHKVTASKPAPKGAPVAHHPTAAGQHVPAAHMTDEQWAALQLPDSNVNAGPFNKALAKLKEWSDSGNVTAIVGAGFGTNTYGKRLATIANHLLALHGSEHKVVAGQKAGEHGAVQATAAADPSPQPDLDSPADMAADHTKPAPAPAAAPEPAAKTDPVAGELQMPDFQEGKTTTGVKALYEKVGQKVIDHGHAGNVSVLEELAEPHKKMWQGKTPNSKKLLALHADALAYAKGEKVSPAAVDAGPKEGDTKPAADGSSLVFKKGRWHKYVDADESGELPPVLVPVSDAGVEKGDVFKLDSQYEKMNAGKWTVYNVSPDGQQVYMHKVGAKVPNQTNSATIPAATLAEAIAKGTAKKEPAAAAPADAAPVPASPQTPQAQSNLAMIPWDKQLLPDTNSNAGSHNKAVGKIKAMAEAGDKAGLQAFIDGKAGAKQTYAKKQALLAQTALAALGGDATAAVPLQQAPDPTPAPAPAPEPAAAPEPPADDKYPLVNAWKQALADGKHPTKEQAEAYEDLTDSDPDAAMEYFMDAVNANVAPGDVDDDKFDEALQAAHQKVHEMHGQALFGKVPKPARVVTADTPLTDGQKNAIESLDKDALEALAGDDQPLPPNVKAAIKQKLADMQPPPAPKPAPKKTVTAVKTTYHNTQDGHSKSWSVHVAPTATAELGFDLVTEYGKIGGTQQKTVKTFPTAQAAYNAADKLKKEKLSKGYAVHNTDYGHKVEIADAAPAAVEQGPKEGDTKQGADGLLVLKDGHWVKMDDGAGSAWSFTQSDPGFSGAMSLYGPDGSIVVYMPGEGAEYHGPNDDEGEPSAQGNDIAGLVKNMAELGIEVPPAAALQKLDPSYIAPAPKPSKPAKPAKTPAAVAKIEAVDPAAAMAWMAAEPGKADGSFIDSLPSKSAQTWFVKWGNAYRGRLKKMGPDSWQTKIALGRALGAAFGHPGLALLTTGEWIPAKQNGVPIEQAKLVETDPAKVKAAAIALKQHMLGAAKGKAAPDAAAQVAAAQVAAPGGGMPSVDGWEKTGGQGGSNPGGKFKDPSGQEWYVKWPNDAEAVKSEVLAAKLYALAGLSAQDCMLVTKGGKTAIATKWVNIKKAGSTSELSAIEGVHAGFAVDAWLGNWDVVGLSLDNLQIGPDGKAHRVDAGGSLEYRAQGEKKPFGTKVDEIDTLRDAAKNDKAAAVFGKMTEADITASVAKVAAISDIAIRAMVNQHGPGDADAKKKLADTLIARKADLLKRYPKAAKVKKKHEFKPEKISAPPSFTNWGGTGKGGPSSKDFLNKANEEAVQAIFAAAKTGDLAAVQNLKAKVYDKDTGKAIGEKPVLDHPSQHVKGYAQQAVNEINYQLNPPKRFRFDGGHPLHALNHAYPAHAGAKSSATAQKLGKFIVLGEPGTVTLQDAGMPAKITHSEGGGTLSQSTYKAAAQAAWNKMPATQRQAVQSYTGSSYHSMNGSLWEGNPSGAAKAAGEALQTLGHDIQPGTVLSRKISLHGDDLNQLLGSKGKVLQEPAIMSTSIRPSSWSGNVHLKLHVGPGVKGLWVGYGSKPDGGGISKNVGEDEMILPPNTRLLIVSTKSSGGKDADGFGGSSAHVIEAIILPTK